MRSFGPGRSWRIATWPPGAAGGLAHELRGLGVLLGAAVREVQPRDVHAGVDHADEHLGVARGGADRGDDLRAAHHRRSTVHTCSPGRVDNVSAMSIETEDELEGLRRAGHVVAVVLRELRRRVQPGVTTAELDAWPAACSRGSRCAVGAEAGLRGAVARCSSASTTRPCTACPAAAARRGDLVKLDVTAELDGFYADACVTPVAARRRRACGRLVGAAAQEPPRSPRMSRRRGRRARGRQRPRGGRGRRARRAVLDVLGGHGSAARSTRSRRSRTRRTSTATALTRPRHHDRADPRRRRAGDPRGR